jgi:hypothetical protein
MGFVCPEVRNPRTACCLTWFVNPHPAAVYSAKSTPPLVLRRFISAPVKLKFVVEPFNIIDLVAIVPWYVITFVGTDFNGTTVFRVVRLLRVFRVLKLGGRWVPAA